MFHTTPAAARELEGPNAPSFRPDAAPLLVCDPQRRVIVASEAAAQLLGRTTAEMRGAPVESFSPESGRPAAIAELARLMRARQGTWGTIDVVLGASGRSTRLEVTCRPRSGAEGFVVALRSPVGPATVAPPSPASRLTDREREVLAGVAEGKTGADLAAELFVSSATVERHVAGALRKLGARNRAHGIAIALRTGVLERPEGEATTAWPSGEQALDALLVQTLEGLEDPAAVLDTEGEVLVVNEAWRAFGSANGRAGVQAEMNYLAACDRAGSDDARRAAWGIRELIENHSQDFTMEYRCDAPDLPRWFELRAVRYHGAASGAAVLVRHRDLTGQRTAENDAQIGRSALDGVNAATVVYSPDGIVTAWLAGAQAMMGWTAEEAIGRPVWDLFSPRRDRARGQAVVEEALRGGRWSGELQLERHDGTTFQADVRVRASTDADGNVTDLVGVAVDISDRYRAKRALTEATAQLRAFADTTRDGWISGDATGRITQVNAATEELLGWRSDELIGRGIDTITAAPSPLRPLTRPRGSGPRQILEECLLAPDGREIPIEYTTTRFSTGEALEQWAIVFRPMAQTESTEPD